MHPVKIHSKAVERLIARVRKVCMALPESSERLSHGEPTWFVGAKAGKGGKVSRCSRTTTTATASST